MFVVIDCFRFCERLDPLVIISCALRRKPHFSGRSPVDVNNSEHSCTLSGTCERNHCIQMILSFTRRPGGARGSLFDMRERRNTRLAASLRASLYLSELALFLWDAYFCLSFEDSKLSSTACVQLCLPQPPDESFRGFADRYSCEGTGSLSTLFIGLRLHFSSSWFVLLPMRLCTSPASHICRRRFSPAILSSPLETSAYSIRHSAPISSEVAHDW